MNPPDIVEYYANDKCLLRINSSIVPPVGRFINITKNTWKVAAVSYAIDYSEKVFERQMRANVELKR